MHRPQRQKQALSLIVSESNILIVISCNGSVFVGILESDFPLYLNMLRDEKPLFIHPYKVGEAGSFEFKQAQNLLAKKKPNKGSFFCLSRQISTKIP